MLPDLSPAHIFIVVAVALIVVGPKDLPMLLRKIGQFMGRMRGMANEFKASFHEMARQSELDELRKEVEAMRAAASAAAPDLSLPNLGVNEAMNGEAFPPRPWEMTETCAAEHYPSIQPDLPEHYPSIQPPEPAAGAAPGVSVEAAPKPARKPRK